MHVRRPAADILAVFFILGAEHLPQRGLLNNNTNETTNSTMTNAATRTATFARPKTTHSPAHPKMNPKYIGFRTYR